MKTFNDYLKERLKSVAIGAKNHNISVEEFIRKIHQKTMAEFEEAQKKNYERKECHSFWRRECENKDIECYRCCHFYSAADWDKMTSEERNNINR